VSRAVADLLETMVAASRRITEVRQHSRPMSALAREQRRTPQGAAFEAALRPLEATKRVEGTELRQSGARIIAECKRRSPSKGILRADYNPAEHARAYAEAGAVAISVLTEPTFFDGDPDHLRAVRAEVNLPILRKDFIVTEYQLLEAAVLGADAALLIAGALDSAELKRLISAATALGLAALVEVHGLDELRMASDAGARMVGVNSRNLRTLDVDLRVFDAVAAALPKDVIAVAESGIRSRGDLDRLSAVGYHAFLVGERLIAAPDPGAALRELRTRP
jgi:indole-3-glycerol phosphate synthase